MSKKRLGFLTILLIATFLVIPLTGCQLAKEEDEINAINETNKKTSNTDTLYGIFLTIGSEARQTSGQQLENTDISVTENGEITFDKDDMTSLNTNEVNGEAISSEDGTIKSIKFHGIKGYFMGLDQTGEVEGEKTNIMMADDEFHDSKFCVNTMEEGEENSLETTLSVNSKFHEILHMNPVYKTENGTYYTIIGQDIGVSFSGGQKCSKTLDSTVTSTIDGITKYTKNSFKINIEVVDEAKHIFIKEMTQSDKLIKNTEYFSDDPEEFVVCKNTKYIIVEEIMTNALDGNYVKRSIYSLDQKNSKDETVEHPCNFPGENNIINGKTIQFIRSN